MTPTTPHRVCLAAVRAATDATRWLWQVAWLGPARLPGCGWPEVAPNSDQPGRDQRRVRKIFLRMPIPQIGLEAMIGCRCGRSCSGSEADADTDADADVGCGCSATHRCPFPPVLFHFVAASLSLAQQLMCGCLTLCVCVCVRR